MAKEEKEGGTTANGTRPNPTTVSVDQALKELMMRPGGLAISIEGEEKPFRLTGAGVTNLKVDSAWIMFTYDGDCIFRTKEFKDRDLFLTQISAGSDAILSVRFTKVCGQLRRPVENDVTAVKKPSGFIPRSRRHHHSNERFSGTVPQELVTED
jgi:hypothetical protein